MPRTVQEIAGCLWLAIFFGSLHFAYARRNDSPLARKIVDGFKALYRKQDDIAMRDWLILVDIILVFLTAVILAAHFLAS